MATEQVLPTLAGIAAARRNIAPHMSPTPLYNYPHLDRLVGTKVWVKHENHLPVGAFKVRGGVNLFSQMDEATRERGAIAASTGNHGQSVAYGARLFGVTARICVPKNANPVKVRAIEDLGAEVIAAGEDFESARARCEELAAEHGYRYIHSGNEPLLIEGVGTHTAELLEQQPQVDTIIVPIGGGSGAAGACIAAGALKSDVKVIGVQSEAAPAAYESWRSREMRTAPIRTAAEGLATGSAFALPQRIIREQLDDFVLVSEEAIRQAQVALIEGTRNLVEGAGAAPLAAACLLSERLAGRTVALICSGGNISEAQLRSLFNPGR